MAAQGQVFYPKSIFPPKQSQSHRIVIVTNSTLASRGNLQFLMVAIIRSASHGGKPVVNIPGHSIPLPAGTIPTLQSDSIIETHQLFSLPPLELKGLSAEGIIPAPIMEDVIKGCKKIF